MPARSAAQEPGADFDGIAPGTAAQSLPDGRQGLRITAVVMAFIGATLIIWASTLPVVIFKNGSSLTSMSLFSINYSNAQVASLEPVVVGILAVSAAIILITAGSRPGRRWLPAGILLASGIQTLMLFIGYQYGDFPPTRPGSAPAVGMAGAGVLVAAGVLGAFGPHDGDLHPSVQRTIRHLAWTALIYVIAGASVAVVGAANVPPNDKGWKYPVFGAVFWVGLAVLVWGIALWFRRASFLKLLRRADDLHQATVTAYRPHLRILTLHAPYDSYLPEFRVHLASWPRPVAPQVGEHVTFRGPGNGVGALLVSGPDRGWTALATGWSRQTVSGAPQDAKQADDSWS